MNERLFIIGNGFDLAHELPTRFSPDFERIAERNETNRLFWDLYQTCADSIWSDFEYLLGKPDFNSLEEILDGLSPDYLSDRESDRDSIITEVDISGNLAKSLIGFAENADEALMRITPLSFFEDLFREGGRFITFNYTHTLEQLYRVSSVSVLHIHGENEKNNLLLGYPEGEFSPELYEYDATMKGRHFRKMDYSSFVESEEDYYIRTAKTRLYEKAKAFSKRYDIDLLADFVKDAKINKIVIYGHSCAIDFPYFEHLNGIFPDAIWKRYVWESNPYDINNTLKLATRVGIKIEICHCSGSGNALERTL